MKKIQEQNQQKKCTQQLEGRGRGGGEGERERGREGERERGGGRDPCSDNKACSAAQHAHNKWAP